jgi:hypothetical protein
MGRGVLLVALLAAPAPAFAQDGQYGEQVSRYEYMYGQPVDVSINDLVSSPNSYDRRAVRTRGQLEMGPSLRRSWVLRDIFGAGVTVVPVPEVEYEFEMESRAWTGREVRIVGAFFVQEGAPRTTTESIYVIQFWKFDGPPDRDVKSGPVKADEVSLETLVSRPGKLDGKNVRVVGKFRGKNLFGDLPARSARDSDDWVIKDDLYAVWVTGKKPKGSGWELDPRLRRDTNKWIEVVGRPETEQGVTYIRALEVLLGSAPREAADAAPPPPPPPKPKVPPVVVFSLPLDGERDVPPSGVFKVQFSKDMDEESFRGRVLFRYAGPRLPGDRDFVGLKLSYDGGRRALIVDPGDVLRPGRVVELRLLKGIIDMDGLALTPRPGRDATAATTDLLRFEVAAQSAFLPGS